MPAHNKNYMSIGVFMVREQQFSALASVVCRQDNARKSPTAYSFNRYQQGEKKTANKIDDNV